MFLVIDGSSMLSTNYYGTVSMDVMKAKTDAEKEAAYKTLMQSSDGVYTNGVFTSLKQILRMMNDQKPEGIVVVFDTSRNTFRRELYTEYKGQRSETPKPLKQQFDTLSKVLMNMNIPVFSSDRYEADDFAGAVVNILEKNGQECVLLSGDKDYYQLVSPKTRLWRIIPTPAKKKYETTYGINFRDYQKDNNLPFGVFEVKYGDGIIAEKEVVQLMPEQFVDYLAVVGDKADNIPGVPGVGPMSIIPLLQKYGSLENIYKVVQEAVDSHKEAELGTQWKNELGIKKSPVKAFYEHKEEAELSRKLAQICVDIPDMPQSVDYYRLDLDYAGLEQEIDRYEMKTLRDYI